MKYGLGFGLMNPPGSTALDSYFWAGAYSTNFWVDPGRDVVGVVMIQVIPVTQSPQQTVRQAGFLNGKPSVQLIIFRQPGANIIQTVDAVKAAIPSLEASIPKGEHFVTVLDRTLTIRASVNDIERTLVISVMLVVAVVFIFLRNVYATLIPAVAVPSKQGILYVFDRVTGKPVWPFEEKPVNQGDVPGEWYSPTQPMPTKPKPYDGTGLSVDDLINFTPELRAEAERIVSKYRLGPIFTPPSVSNA